MRIKKILYLILIGIVFAMFITSIIPKNIYNKMITNKIFQDTQNYIDLSNVKIKSNIITNVFSVEDIKNKIKTNGTIKITKNNLNVSSLSTGSKIEISFPDRTYSYMVAVPGDLTGNGKTTIADIAKLYQYLKGKIEIDEYSKVAGNVVGDSNKITVADVAKLYQYLKGKINYVNNETIESDTIAVENIEIDSDNISLGNGSKIKISTTVYPYDSTNKKITYSSSNNNVATIDNSGNITAVGVGEATITAKSNNNKTASIKVTVSSDITYKSSGYNGVYDGNSHGITVEASGATIKYGTTEGTYNLIENPTYIDVGTYTVYYQITKEGYNTITGSEKVIIRSVNVQDIQLKDSNGISLQTKQINSEIVYSLAIPKSTNSSIKATVSPSNATNKNLIWTSSNETIATVNNNGVISPKKEGSTIITVKSESNNSVLKKILVTVKYDLSNPSEKVVGIYYSTWFNEDVHLSNFCDTSVNPNGCNENTFTLYNRDIYTNTFFDITAKHIYSGPIAGVKHYWGKPARDYYTYIANPNSNSDKEKNANYKKIVKEHLLELKNIGIDFIVIDNTNVYDYWYTPNRSTWVDVYVNYPESVLFEAIRELRYSGKQVPYVINWQRDESTINSIYNELYSDHSNDDIWAYENNKPMILGVENSTISSSLKEKISFRRMATTKHGDSTFNGKTDWSYWEDDNDFGTGQEEVSIAPALANVQMSNEAKSIGRRNGCTLYEQWQTAFNKNPKVVIISEYNEWIVSRHFEVEGKNYEHMRYTDLYNAEYSRDFEAQEGGLKDRYIKWLKEYISYYKSNKTIPEISSVSDVSNYNQCSLRIDKAIDLSSGNRKNIPNTNTISILGDTASAYTGKISATNSLYAYKNSLTLSFYPNDTVSVTNENDMWYKKLASSRNYTILSNESINNTRVTWDGKTNNDEQNIGEDYYMAGYTRINRIGNADKIFVFAGLYDIIDTTVQLNDNDEFEYGKVDNFADAYYTMITRIILKYPNSKIICVVPYINGFGGDYLTRFELAKALIIQIQEKIKTDIKNQNNISDITPIRYIKYVNNQYLDNLYVIGIDELTADNTSVYLYQGIIPNKKGQELIANSINDTFNKNNIN